MRTFKKEKTHTEKFRILYIPCKDSLTESNITAYKRKIILQRYFQDSDLRLHKNSVFVKDKKDLAVKKIYHTMYLSEDILLTTNTKIVALVP